MVIAMTVVQWIGLVALAAVVAVIVVTVGRKRD